MLLVNHLSFNRNEKKIFKELDIAVAPKKIVHIAGRNGIGKTTLIKILANVLIPSSGEIYWNGKNIKKNLKEYYKNLTYIMDSQTSRNEMTILENVQFWIKLFSSTINSTELDSIFNLLSLEKNAKVSFLSKGEKRKLELCRLVLEKKKLWILDEPFIGLDKISISLIIETFKNHAENNGMIVFSSHFQPELQNMDTIQLEHYAYN